MEKDFFRKLLKLHRPFRPLLDGGGGGCLSLYRSCNLVVDTVSTERKYTLVAKPSTQKLEGREKKSEVRHIDR